MFSIPFNHVNNDGKGLMLNLDLTYGNPKKGATSFVADQIWVWNPTNNSYDKFFYWAEDGDEGWSLDEGEMPYFEEVYEDGLAAGAAFYFKPYAGSGDKSITFKKTF